MTKSLNRKIAAIQEKIKGQEPKDRTKKEWRLNKNTKVKEVKKNNESIVSIIKNKILNKN